LAERAERAERAAPDLADLLLHLLEELEIGNSALGDALACARILLALLPKLRHAGAIFLGRWSSEAIGDYCAGPNHVLPTSGTARFSSPLGVYDFQKRSSLIGVSRQGARKLGKLASTLARGEGLFAHARSADMRVEKRR